MHSYGKINEYDPRRGLGTVSDLLIPDTCNVYFQFDTIRHIFPGLHDPKQKDLIGKPLWYEYSPHPERPQLYRAYCPPQDLTEDFKYSLHHRILSIWKSLSQDITSDQRRVAAELYGAVYLEKLDASRVRLAANKARADAEEATRRTIALEEKRIADQLANLHAMRRELEASKMDTRLTTEQTSRIKDICRERGILQLVHFTQSQNLESILKYGLVPLTEQLTMKRRGIHPLTSDSVRHDGQNNAVSLSVGFPNYKMFMRKRCDLINSSWAVLVLDPAILWELDCSFCPENASSNAVRHIDGGYLSLNTPEHFGSLFQESIRNVSNPHFTSNPQAEVLVRGWISPDYIREVITDTKHPFFGPRSDYNHWKRPDESGTITGDESDFHG